MTLLAVTASYQRVDFFPFALHKEFFLQSAESLKQA